MGARLIAVVADGNPGRIYLTVQNDMEKLARVDKPADYPDGELAYYPGHLNTKVYGLDHFADLFTNRQLTTLSMLSELLPDIQQEVYRDVGTDDHDERNLADGGAGRFAAALSLHAA